MISKSEDTKINLVQNLKCFEKFVSKSDFFICFPGSSIEMANMEEESDEFATCLRLIMGAACLFVGFSLWD